MSLCYTGLKPHKLSSFTTNPMSWLFPLWPQSRKPHRTGKLSFLSLSILLLQAFYLPQVNLAFSRVTLGCILSSDPAQWQTSSGQIAHFPVRGGFSYPLVKSCHDLQPPSLLPEYSVIHAQDMRVPGPGTCESGSCVSHSLSISLVKQE